MRENFFVKSSKSIGFMRKFNLTFHVDKTMNYGEDPFFMIYKVHELLDLIEIPDKLLIP